jgi:hypothetical protein
MVNVTPDQLQKLQDVAEAIEDTDYGRDWPPEYSEFYKLWGFFNSIYNILYANPHEWQRIGQFSIDSRFALIWDRLAQSPAVRNLAEQPCVGDGRYRYAPSPRVRIAFHTLRSIFQINLQNVCQSAKCQSRHQKNIPICLTQQWLNSPQVVAKPEDAPYTPLGATLLIVYQIRNNLVHGSKGEIQGPEYQRNLLLVQNGGEITRTLLEEVKKLI